MTPRERERIEYEIESLERAENHERNTRNHTRNPEEFALCSLRIADLKDTIYKLRGRLRTKRVTRKTIQ